MSCSHATCLSCASSTAVNYLLSVLLIMRIELSIGDTLSCCITLSHCIAHNNIINTDTATNVHHIQHIFIHLYTLRITVPEFIIGPTITVNESTPDVEICVSTSSPLAPGINITVTVETGMKNGAMYQATGKIFEI